MCNLREAASSCRAAAHLEACRVVIVMGRTAAGMSTSAAGSPILIPGGKLILGGWVVTESGEGAVPAARSAA